jgi:hypothetical protein
MMLSVTHAVWLEPALVCERISVHALSLTGAPEENVGGRHNQIVDDTATSDKAEAMLVSNSARQQCITTYLTNQPSTLLDPLLSCKNDKQGKHMTTKKQ